MRDLTPRQREIAHLVATEGLSAKGIARRLGISRRTVEKHITTAAKRIDGPHGPRVKLVLWWIENNQRHLDNAA